MNGPSDHLPWRPASSPQGVQASYIDNAAAQKTVHLQFLIFCSSRDVINRVKIEIQQKYVQTDVFGWAICRNAYNVPEAEHSHNSHRAT